MTPAAQDVLAERERQMAMEGWTPAHDDEHRQGELAAAAACYAAGNRRLRWPYVVPRLDCNDVWRDLWPWERSWWKPTDRRRDLVKAGALILAEIERLDRLAARQMPGPGTPPTAPEEPGHG